MSQRYKDVLRKKCLRARLWENPDFHQWRSLALKTAAILLNMRVIHALNRGITSKCISLTRSGIENFNGGIHMT